MKEVEISIDSSSFPSNFVSDREKATKKFGLRIGQAIQYEWFRRDKGQCRFYSQWNEFHKLRLYARGEQSMSKYKDEISVDGDLSYINLDWTNVSILPKMVDIVVNGTNDRMFSVKAYSQDASSVEKRNKYQDNIEADMVAKDLLLQIKDDTGVDAFNTDPEDLPENDEELMLRMQLKYKPAIELAEEASIKTILSENKYTDIKKQTYYDITTLGIGIEKHEFLPGAGVKISHVDPANVVYSYTEDPHFKDVFYWGEIKTVPIGEVVKIDESITNSDLEKISKYSQSWNQYHTSSQIYDNSLFKDGSVTLLYFSYKTTKNFVYKKKLSDTGGEKVIEKTDEFNPPEEMMSEGRFEKIQKTIDVWYEGVMVMGTNIILKWEMSENMARPKSATQNVLSNYVACAPRMYKGVINSLLKRMIPFADLIQLIHLKLQQVILKTVPDGVFIDADGINEVDLGNGASYNPDEALKMYFQTGSVIGRSFTQEGEFNHARVPIQELNSNSGQAKINSLVSSYNHYLSMLRDVTGLNEARDGSSPDPDALVGVQKLAALNSNTATRHILDAGLDITRDIAEGLSYRISDVLEYADFREEFKMKIGKFNVNLLNEIKDLPLYDFSIFIEVSPDEEEKAQLEQNIQIALSRNGIDLEDAIDIREIQNIKYANQLLKVKRKKKREADQQQAMQSQQMQAQVNMQSQQAAAQIAMQKIQAETQSKMQVSQAEAAFSIEKLKGEAEIKSQLMQLEFQMNMQLKGLEVDALRVKDKGRNEAESNRISQRNTQQSKMIEQRKNNGAAINFESSEDSLDGFDLSEFDPR